MADQLTYYKSKMFTIECKYLIIKTVYPDKTLKLTFKTTSATVVAWEHSLKLNNRKSFEQGAALQHLPLQKLNLKILTTTNKYNLIFNISTKVGGCGPTSVIHFSFNISYIEKLFVVDLHSVGWDVCQWSCNQLKPLGWKWGLKS